MFSEIDINTALVALGLTFVAGLSTGIGSLMAFFTDHTDRKFLSCALGLSAGVMIYVSFMDLLPMAAEDIALTVPGKLGSLYVTIAFFVGVALIAVIDFLVPEDENPHEVKTVENMTAKSPLGRTGFMLAGAIALHNFPEGMATFVSALNGLDVALPIVIAIAIHNIPEGIAVSIPIYHATGKRNKALKWSLLSGLAEPLGAVFGLAFLMPFWNPVVGALVMSGVAGIMVYISFDELLPGSERYGHHHLAMTGVIGGMLFMSLSLLLF